MLTRTQPVPGAPRWAVVAAWLTILCVLPSGIWRTLVGLGVDLGWSQAHLDLEHIPGSGTGYVLYLTVASLGAAGLTLGLVQPWGEVFPRWTPVLGGRRVPLALATGIAILGVTGTAYLVVGSIVNWSAVSGFGDRPRSGWARLMAACYLPATLWPVLLLAVTAAYVVRRARNLTGRRPARRRTHR